MPPDQPAETGPGPDLLLDLAGSRSRTALEHALREAIASGRLAPTQRLPSSRLLSVEVGLARNTVAQAYAQLVAEGWLVARQGSGTHVADRTSAVESARCEPARPLPRRHFDLTPGVPDLAGFPRTRWLRASERALHSVPHDNLGYPDPRGDIALRGQLAAYLSRARGVRAGPEQIIVCSGFVQALGLVSRVLASTGAVRVAVEACGLDLHRRVLAEAGLRVVSVPVDASGACTQDLTDENAVLLTPAHQFPLGVGLAPARRAAVLDWARDRGAFVFEDDYDGEFRYDRRSELSSPEPLSGSSISAPPASRSRRPSAWRGWPCPPD